MIDNYVYVIVALLPLAAFMVIFQANPYNALVMRGILGAVAAFVYTVLGAADVALTEALVGTMLAITLYAIAVRSSLVLRLGILSDDDSHHLEKLQDNVRTIFRKHHLRLELLPYTDLETLHQGLINKEVHAICVPTDQDDATTYHTKIRVRRVYDIIQTELTSPVTSLSYVDISEISTPNLKAPVLGEHP